MKEDFKLNCRAVKLLCRIYPQAVLWSALSNLVYAAAPYFGVYMSAQLVNELAGNCDGKRLAALAAVTVLGSFLLNLLSRIVTSKNNIAQSGFLMKDEIFWMERQNEMPYLHLENPDITILREEIFAAKNATGGGLLRVYFSCSSIWNQIVQIVMSLALSVSILRMTTDRQLTGFPAFANSPWSVLSLAVLVVIVSYAGVRLSNANSAKVMKEWDELAKANTLHSVLGSLWSADCYIFDFGKIVLPLYEKKLLHPQYLVNVNRFNARYRVCAVLLSAAVNLWLFLLVGAKAYAGVFGIGNYILYRSTISKLIGAVRELALGIGALRFNSVYLVRLFRYLDLPDEMYHGTLAVEKRDDIDFEIEFRDVSFCYPRTEEYALKHINMKIRIGEKLAIVGENGSGKTTFIKLLCRLYDPTEGKILLNGIDVSRYRYDEYLNLFSVVFQDYKLFAFSLAANVSAQHDYDRKRVCDSLARAGLQERLAEMKQGIETALGRDYENEAVDLSGGEMQKVALARALYKDAPFVVLDEPTAALDPVAEAEVYANFNRLVENKTSVFISHRLSSCRFCDDIVVFDHGEIIQRGSHGELLRDEKGKYHELWNAQAKYYAEEFI